MNRYRSGGPSKATPATVCQKCLKKGHFTYECTAAQQERPYVSRPSRSQQLLNPKLAPKLSATAPPIPEAKKPSPTQEEHSGPGQESPQPRDLSKGRQERSSSAYSSDSVSTISTNRSRSRSRSRRPHRRGNSVHKLSRSRDHQRRSSSVEASLRLERPRSRRRFEDDVPPKSHSRRDSLPRRVQSRSPNRRKSPGTRRRSRSRSPYRGDRGMLRGGARAGRQPAVERSSRERSLSPYSRRVAMTRERKDD